MMASLPDSDAKLRNAFVGDLTVENAAAIVAGTLVLVDRATTYDDPSACGEGACVNGVLGVLRMSRGGRMSPRWRCSVGHFEDPPSKCDVLPRFCWVRVVHFGSGRRNYVGHLGDGT